MYAFLRIWLQWKPPKFSRKAEYVRCVAWSSRGVSSIHCFSKVLGGASLEHRFEGTPLSSSRLGVRAPLERVRRKSKEKVEMKPTGYLGRCPGDGLTVWMRRVLRGAAYSALAIVCSLSIRASAETETVGGVRYSYRVIDGQAEIYDAREASEPLTIPSNLGGYPVTSIGESAFYNSGSFTSVTIPKSVTSIGDKAFYNCGSLTSVTIPAGVTHIGDWAFWNCGLRSVALPNGVTNIGASAFRGCSGLTSVTIPDSVTNIGESAFCDCRALRSVTIPSSVTSIGNYAFQSCGLRSVALPNGVTSIGNSAFGGCGYLTHVTIPNSVTNIGRFAFSSCTALKSVKIPSSVTSIGDGVFGGCSALESVTIPNSVTNIAATAFSECKGIRSVVVPSCVTRLSATFPDSYYYRQIESAVIAEGATRVEDSMFEGCTALKSVTIPSSVTSIGVMAFGDCSSLTNVTIPASVTNIGVVAFSNCSSLTSVTIPGSVTCIGDFAFEDCSSLRSVTLPDGVTSVGTAAFCGCSGLTSVTIPKSVESIGDLAFEDCTALETVYVQPDDGDRIWGLLEDSGYDASGIEFVELVNWKYQAVDGGIEITGIDGDVPNALIIPSQIDGFPVVGIGTAAFCGRALESVTIPDGVTRIGDWAFEDCTALRKVYVQPGDGDRIWGLLEESGHDVSGIELVELVNWTYHEVEGGLEITGIEGNLPDTLIIPPTISGLPVVSIGKLAFSGCSSLTSVTIPDSVTSIGNRAFWGCGGLADAQGFVIVRGVLHGYQGKDSGIVIPEGVTCIGNSAFRGCSGLTRVTIPSNVTSIGAKAFDSCRALETVYVDLGDADRVKRMMSNSGCDVTGLTFVELSGEALPELPADATAADVAVAFMGVADQRVIENITSVEEYETYRQWALGVKGADGTAAGTAAVAASPHAWLSYALDAEVLIDEPLQDGDVKVEAFKATATAGVFDLTVSVKGVAVGGKATAANLAKVVSVVGGETLDNLSAENVEVWFERPAGGKIRFSAGPKGETPPSSFFIKVIILP